MDLDCEMDMTFAKRLHKQQMRSPTSTLVRPYSVTSSCKRRFEPDDDLDSKDDVNNVSETATYKTEETFTTSNKTFKVTVKEEEFSTDAIKENFKTDNEPFTVPVKDEEYSTAVIKENSTTEAKHLFCEINVKTPEKHIFSQKYEMDITLRLHNRRQEIRSGADRYIPSRVGNNWQTEFSSNSDLKPAEVALKKFKDCSEDISNESVAYNCILRNELLGQNIEGITGYYNELRAVSSPENKKLFNFSSTVENSQNIEAHAYSLSPVGSKTQKLLRTPCKSVRKISKIPFKVLDAPDLQNDFYLNLVDWSSQNMLSVGLGNSVYLWSACTSQVVRLCDLTNEANSVTSVAWHERGNYLALGTHSGVVQIWDVTVSKKIAQLTGHSARVGSAAWNDNILATGSRDKMILLRDLRISNPSESPCCVYSGHRQEVCGLKWSPDGQYLASGGNDNRLCVWNKYSFSPLQTYGDHVAAVKAIAWSPHQHGLLASGGGTADRCIRFWNTLTGQPIQCVDTGSQVCNLAWSKNSSELVSTHGYSQNQIVVWKYPSLTQMVKLTGHSFRVLYLAMSPDGESIVTGAGDETLRFWNIFSKTSSQKENKSVLNLFSTIR